MSYGTSMSMCRPATTQTTSASKPVYPAAVNPPSKSPRCCENGRAVMIDPISGRTICSCQLKSSASAYLSRVPGLPDAVYGGSSTSPVFQPNVVIGNDPAAAAYYQAMGLKGERPPEGAAPGAAPPSGAASSYYLEHLMAAHPYNAFYPGFDFNSARRKNATRETTSALKAWLYEHRKNPYPTKGEKIMLAIITRMTLTQVSTWFANARRRLKKENKIDDKDDTLCEIDLHDKDDSDHINCDLSSGDEDADTIKHRVDLSDISDTDDPLSSGSTLSPSCADRLAKPEFNTNIPQDYRKLASPSDNKRHVSNYVTELPTGIRVNKMADERRSRDHDVSGNSLPSPRPKIWSISEIISKSSSPDSS